MINHKPSGNYLKILLIKGSVNQLRASYTDSWVMSWVGEMRDVLREEWGLLNKPLSTLGIALAVIMTLSVSYNALWAQASHHSRNAPQNVAASELQASSRVDVVVPATKQNTIVLRYDPQIEELQRNLLATGDYHGQVDGVKGKQTKAAIENYQRKSGLPVNGQISSELLEHISFTRQIADAAQYTASVEKPEAKSSTAEIRQLQTALADLGYEPGEITGNITPQTQQAIVKFEKDYKLPEETSPTPQLLAEIARLTGDPLISLTD